MWLSRLFKKDRDIELLPHRRWPIRSHANDFELETFRLRIFGAVHAPREIGLDDLRSLPEVEVLADVNVGRGRSTRHWRGVDARRLVCSAGPEVSADWLVVHSDGGYLHRLPLDRFYDGTAVLAHTADERPLTRSEGGPLRLVLPHLEPWRCAKWVRALELEVGTPS